jgi:DNA polymerase (family 10)
VAQRLLQFLRECKAIDRVEIAGSARRWKEIVNDLDFVASTTKPAEITEHFLKMPFATSLIARGDTKTSVRLDTMNLNVDLRVVAPAQFASALHHFTGSKEHNVVLRTLAKKKGYKINEYGVFHEKNDKPVPLNSEEEFYSFFKMDYIPPEMRENLGEIEAAQKHRIPKLVEQKDLAGVFHVHSVWSDGRNSLEEMIRAAADRGYKYVGISEHSQAAAYAHGLDAARLLEQSHEIDQLQKKYSGIRILKGIEVDILPDGNLDMDEASLSRLDFVIASVHSAFRLDEAAMTERICRAIAHPLVDILGHPTGRILQGRSGYAVNLDEVFKAALRHKKCIEINASPHRLDLDWKHVKQAVDLGIPLAIDPDAHRTTEFDYVPFGIGMARKGWAKRADILNTLPWNEIAGTKKKIR